VTDLGPLVEDVPHRHVTGFERHAAVVQFQIECLRIDDTGGEQQPSGGKQ
jgi:hypothetical protein